MKRTKNNACVTAILLANGYDEKFVTHCVHELREARIRTYLIGRSQTVVSWHGVEIRTDEQLRDFAGDENTRLIIVPGESECVSNLALEPKVQKLIQKVLAQDGWVAVSRSAEIALKQQKQTLPTNMHILHNNHADHYLLQGDQNDREFIRSIINSIR